MKTIVVDTNILLEFPQIIASPSELFKVIVPDVVLHEYFPMLEARTSLGGIGQKIKEAQAKEHFQVGATDLLDVVLLRSGKLSVIDQLILAFVADYIAKNQNDDVALVTLDRALIEASTNAGVPTMSLKELQNLTDSVATQSFSQIKDMAEKSKRNGWKQTLVNILVSAISGLVVNLIPANWPIVSGWLTGVFNAINIWGTIIVIPLLGFLLFWIRSRFRLIYGCIETIIGLTTAIWVFVPNFDLTLIDLVRGLQLMGGLYVIVRGLDNVGVGLQSSSFVRLSRFWNNIFSKK